MPRLESSVASRNDARWWLLTAVLFLAAPAVAGEVPGQKTFDADVSSSRSRYRRSCTRADRR